MFRIPSLLFVPFLVTATLTGSARQARDAAVTEAALAGHVKALVGSEGRRLGSAGARAAADYIAARFERLGLEPGEGDSYFQELALIDLRYEAPPELVFTLESGEKFSGISGVGFQLFPRGCAAGTEDLPIRSVSIIKKFAPDPDPRVAIYVEGTALRRRNVLKTSKLENLGGFGLELEANVDARHAKPLNKPSVPRPKIVSRSELDRSEGCERIVLRGDMLRRFVTDGPVSAQLLVQVEETNIPAVNLVARIPGVGAEGRPELAGQAVIVSARYDAPGRGSPNSAPRVAQAVDEATGVAALLELAEAFAGGDPPARTILFVLSCGWEYDRLGLDGYLDDPVVPIEDTVAWINLDRFGRSDPKLADEEARIWITGEERSDLHELTLECGIAIAIDPHPNSRMYVVLGDLENGARGVISHSLSSFPVERSRGVILGVDEMDYAHLAAATRDAYAVVLPLADGRITPKWRDGMRPKGIRGLLRSKNR